MMKPSSIFLSLRLGGDKSWKTKFNGFAKFFMQPSNKIFEILWFSVTKSTKIGRPSCGGDFAIAKICSDVKIFLKLSVGRKNKSLI